MRRCVPGRRATCRSPRRRPNARRILRSACERHRLLAQLDAARCVATAAGTAAADGVCFTVSDTGSGIPPEEFGHVFDWFWHAPRDGERGSGLGLAIAMSLLEAHHARLHVGSAPEQENTFWFTVPALADARYTFGGATS